FGTISVAGAYNVTGTSNFSGATVNFNSTVTSTGALNITGGSVFFNSNNLTVPTINLSGGTLGGTIAQVTSTGLLTWSGGTMSGTGVTNANGGILIDNAQVFLDTRTLNNAVGQTATLSNFAEVLVQNGATFNNNGTFLAQGNTGSDGFFDNGGGGTFNNTGTFTRNTGTTDFVISSGVAFNNSGTVNVQTGSLTLGGGDSGNTTGSFNISSGATLHFSSDFNLAATSLVSGAGTMDFNSGTVDIAGTYNVTGTSSFSGATVNFNSPITSLGALSITSGAALFNSNNVTVPTINLSGGGTLGGTIAQVTSTGLLTWSGGTMSGTGVTNANGGILIDNAQVFLDTRTLNNAVGQTATLSNFAEVLVQNGATFNNNGTFLAQGNTGSDGFFDNGGGGTFNNTGTFTRNTGTTGFFIGSNIVFNNTGTVNVQSGLLSLGGGDGGSTTGDFNVSAGATLNFASDFNLAAASSVSGAGSVDFSFGTISVAGAYNVTGTSNFSGATVNFNSTVTSTGALNITGGSVFFNSNNLTVPTINLSGGTLGGTIAQVTSTGLLTWSGGAMSGTGVTNANGGILIDNAQVFLDTRTLNNAVGQTATLSNFAEVLVQNGATFNNNGTFLAQGNTGSDGLFDNGGGGTFNNTGTFTRNTGTTDFVISSGVAFNNSGTVNANTGTIHFDGGYTQTAGTLNLAGGAVASASGLDIQGGTLTGIGSITSDITNRALLRPSLGLGGLSVTGNVSLLATSQLSFQLGGLTQGTQYSFLNVNGTVSLGGQLVVSFVNSFQATNSNNFTVLSSTGPLAGAFSNVASGTRLSVTDGSGSFLVTYSGDDVILSDFEVSLPRGQPAKESNTTYTIKANSSRRVDSWPSSDEARPIRSKGSATSMHGKSPRVGIALQDSDQLRSLMNGGSISRANGVLVVQPTKPKVTNHGNPGSSLPVASANPAHDQNPPRNIVSRPDTIVPRRDN
ncbi:MAG: S-layer family protein, partial [Chthoniobacterales bacterium]|nr:S-layer family protein [Chthoniobacterales bacterium]